jgi:hypothetical protein
VVTIERDGWTVSRRLGVGDREHVRAGLLQIYCMDTTDVVKQCEGALMAAKKLQKTARIYINTKKLPPNITNHIIMSTFGQHRDHDLMEESDLSRKRFDWVLGRCDIIVTPHGGTTTALRDMIIETWNSTDGREITGGNHGQLPEIELRKRFPQFYGGEEQLWEQYNK